MLAGDCSMNIIVIITGLLVGGYIHTKLGNNK